MNGSRLYRTEAIVLRRQDLGEADRILTLYTPDYGKIRAVAKGVRKPSSRKAGHLEPFTRVDVLIAHGRDLDIVSQAEMLDAYLPLRDDLERGAYANYFAELLDSFVEEGDENRALYLLLAAGLGWLCATDNLQRSARYYELRLLALVGFRPQLQRCVVGGEEIMPEAQFFSPADGGVVCPRCGASHPRARPVSLGVLKVLRYLQTRDFAAVERLRLRPALQDELEQVTQGILTYNLERRLKSVAFLRQLRELPTLRGNNS
jgi:DNA repair protein RecO (recombination protein O)